MKNDIHALDAILVDRDGTVIEEKHYLHDPDQVVLVPGAGRALARLSTAGKRVFCVTNQSGIGRGYYATSDFEATQARLAALLADYGAVFTAVSFCPHAPDEKCRCRKPATGQWRDLAGTHGLDPARAIMIGDNASDVAFGLAAGLAATVLVLTGHGRSFAKKLGLPETDRPHLIVPGRRPDQPHVLARDLPAAVDWLLGRDG